jgi:2-methylcitrate dehydratase PrpD
MHVPTPTVKYNLMPGNQSLGALHSAYLADLGHRSDQQILDDAEYGYPRYIGTRRWEPSQLTTDLGTEWGFLAAMFFKPYPHCRVTHAVLDALIDVVRTNDIKPGEIEVITAYGEQWASDVPTFMNRTISDPYEAQFSFPHGIAMAAHLIPPGKDWQDPSNVYSPSVLGLMEKVVWKSHPDWATAVSANPAARPTRVEVLARGETFVGERSYPKGSPSPDPSTYMTDSEVVDKFLHNAKDAITDDAARQIVHAVMHLEAVKDVSAVLQLLRPQVARSANAVS